MTISIIGGLNKDRSPKLYELNIGEKSKYFIESNTRAWASFKKTYSTDDKLQKNYLQHLINAISIILPINSFIIDYDIIIDIVNIIFDVSNEELINGITNYLVIDYIEDSIKTLFFAYKVYIEDLLDKYSKLRNIYIKKHNTKDKLNDWSDIYGKWDSYDKSYELETSSLILFFNFPNIELKEEVPKLNLDIQGIDLPLNKIKKFEYKGYCRLVPKERLNFLLNFPVNDLIKSIEMISAEKNDKKKTKKILKEIKILNSKLELLKKPSDLNFKKPEIPKESNNTIQFITNCGDATIALYNIIKKPLMDKEKKIEEISISINNISKLFLHYKK